MSLHKRGVHEGKKDELCVQCGRTFLYKQVLQNHIKSVHEGRKDHKCKHCGKGFSELGGLKRHIMTVHEGLKPYQCPHCSIAYGQNGDLKRHIQKVHFKNIWAIIVRNTNIKSKLQVMWVVQIFNINLLGHLISKL